MAFTAKLNTAQPAAVEKLGAHTSAALGKFKAEMKPKVPEIAGVTRGMPSEQKIQPAETVKPSMTPAQMESGLWFLKDELKATRARVSKLEDAMDQLLQMNRAQAERIEKLTRELARTSRAKAGSEVWGDE